MWRQLRFLANTAKGRCFHFQKTPTFWSWNVNSHSKNGTSAMHETYCIDKRWWGFLSMMQFFKVNADSPCNVKCSNSWISFVAIAIVFLVLSTSLTSRCSKSCSKMKEQETCAAIVKSPFSLRIISRGEMEASNRHAGFTPTTLLQSDPAIEIRWNQNTD